jgi:hypothetical protein
MNVMMWKYYTIGRFFDVTKFSTVTPLSLLISYKLSFPVFGLKIVPTFALKTNKIFVTLGSDQIHILVPQNGYLFVSSLYSQLVHAHSEQ